MYNDIFNHRDHKCFFYPNKYISCNSSRFEKPCKKLMKSRVGDYKCFCNDMGVDDIYQGITEAICLYLIQL